MLCQKHTPLVYVKNAKLNTFDNLIYICSYYYFPMTNVQKEAIYGDEVGWFIDVGDCGDCEGDGLGPLAQNQG